MTLEEEQYAAAWEFAVATASRHKSFGREPLRKQEDIFLGKQGEIAYCLMYGIPLSTLSADTFRKSDPGWDLVHDGMRIDVKTRVIPFKRVQFNPDYAHCDSYAVVVKNKDTKVFTHILTMDKTIALRIARNDRGVWFWDFGADWTKLADWNNIARANLKI